MCIREFYGGPPHAEGTPEDPARDAATLPLIRAAVTEGIPVLAICRGFQELNVALGGTLHQRLQDLSGRISTTRPRCRRSPRSGRGRLHTVRLARDGWLVSLVDVEEIAVKFSRQSRNRRALPPASLWRPPPSTARIEAVRVIGNTGQPAAGFAVGVQWHPRLQIF